MAKQWIVALLPLYLFGSFTFAGGDDLESLASRYQSGRIKFPDSFSDDFVDAGSDADLATEAKLKSEISAAKSARAIQGIAGAFGSSTVINSKLNNLHAKQCGFVAEKQGGYFAKAPSLAGRVGQIEKVEIDKSSGMAVATIKVKAFKDGEKDFTATMICPKGVQRQDLMANLKAAKIDAELHSTDETTASASPPTGDGTGKK